VREDAPASKSTGGSGAGGSGGGGSFGADQEPTLEELKKQVEEQKAKNELASLKRASLTDRLGLLSVPADGAPAGTMTLNAGAGAVAPWLAGRAVAVGAGTIAEQVKQALTPATTTTKHSRPVSVGRVLVVSDREAIARDVVYQDVKSQVERCEAAVSSASDIVLETLALDPLLEALEAVEALEALADALGEDILGEAAAGTEGLAQVAATEADGDTGGGDGSEAADTGEGAETPAAPSLLGSAVDLLKLLRTDYAVTATDVAVGDAAFADIVAGRLAEKHVETVRSGFAVLTRTDGLLSKIDSVLAGVIEVRESLTELDRRLAVQRKSVELLTSRVGKLQEAWIKAVAEDPGSDGAAGLKTALDQLTNDLERAAEPIGPAEAASTYVRGLLDTVETTCLGLLAPASDGKTAPLEIAVVHETLHRGAGDQESVTHLLFAELLGIHADTVTRNSLLGSDGRLHHVATVNIAWMLHDTEQGKLVGGGSLSPACQFVFDTNAADTSPWLPNVGGSTSSPWFRPETVLKFVVVLLALMLGSAAVLLGWGSFH
jgi:uncharacterized coiled-coil protein SlyX